VQWFQWTSITTANWWSTSLVKTKRYSSEEFVCRDLRPRDASIIAVPARQHLRHCVHRPEWPCSPKLNQISSTAALLQLWTRPRNCKHNPISCPLQCEGSVRSLMDKDKQEVPS
jgi:hypothetical protein